MPAAVKAGRRPGARRAGWLAVLIALGVVAMHGLGCHGTAAGDLAMDMTHPASSAATPAPMAMYGTADTIAPVHDSHGMPEAGLLCVAVLAGAVLLLLLTLRRARYGGVLPRRRRSPAPPFASVRRSTGPPAVWEFSVIRC